MAPVVPVTPTVISGAAVVLFAVDVIGFALISLVEGLRVVVVIVVCGDIAGGPVGVVVVIGPDNPALSGVVMFARLSETTLPLVAAILGIGVVASGTCCPAKQSSFGQ